jgi:hypothetical protein
MGYPELDRDESIILEAKNVKFKSISFDARLTTRRVILIDSRKNIIPPREILLATIWKVEAGENAIRDHLLTLTVVNNAGEKDQIVLTFPRLAGTERKRECNDWARKLQGLIRPTPAEPERTARKGSGPEPLEKHKPEIQKEMTGRHPVKKKIEVARPLSKITEPSPPLSKITEPSPPPGKITEPSRPPLVPVETSSLPSGTFCSRCGNRVPPESTFCNHCGTPVRQQVEPALARPAESSRVQVPVQPQSQITVPPQAGSAAGKQDRPIEQIIHSIEPLIEDSVPRSQPTPLVKKRAPQIVSEPDQPESTTGPVPQESQPESMPAPVVPESPAEAPPAVVWPVLHSTDSPLATVQEPVPELPESPPPTPPSATASKLPGTLAIAVLVIVVLAFIAGLIIAANFTADQPAPGVNVTPIKTTVATTPATPRPTTVRTTAPATAVSTVPAQALVPSTGIWARITYPGTYTGLIGTPGNLKDVTDTGEHLYSISTNDGIVLISVQKNDGSADKILAEVYKNGVMVKSSSTVTPRGIVEIQFDLKTLESGSANTTPAS